MTTKTIARAKTIATAERFPDFPPRDDMQNFLHLSRPSHMTALKRFYAAMSGVSVVSEVPIAQRLGGRVKTRVPDLMVSFDSNWDLILEQRGYSIEDQGGPPHWVLEVASPTTSDTDENEKRDDYALFSIFEYWRFDPTGGERYEAALAGDRLVNGNYRPILIEWLDDEHCRGWSEALGLYVCWERGQLRFYDPKTRQYLRTHDDEADRANREADRANRAEADLIRLRARLRDLGADDV